METLCYYEDQYGYDSLQPDKVIEEAVRLASPLRKQLEQIAQEKAIAVYRQGLVDSDSVMQRRKQYARQKAAEQVTKIQEFILGIIQLGYELSKEEKMIKVGTGQRQPRKRIQHIVHAQQSRADKEKENENQLLQLDPYHALVKMIKNDPQNPGKKCMKCGLRNANGARYCVSCDTKLPAPNEYIIKTIEPEQGLYGKVLQGRIERIQ